MKPSGAVFDSSWRRRCRVSPCSREQASPMIARHYLGKWPGVCVLTLGIWCDGVVVGVVVFALPPRETSKRYGAEAWELARLWVDGGLPSNAETWALAQAVRYVRGNRKDVSVLVSYADPSAGHQGTIYKAGNWSSDGRTDQERKTPRFDYADSRTGKRYSRRSHVPEGVEIVRIPRVSKHRFVYRLRGQRTGCP